ncbi:unnamed protein product [Prorocentrum cordatum]|uniref:Uncharacterized protein n=1 Tax=Prorocentrum cordatum TaxID=2364126 RepID=A0ABN9TMI6_9DINO|nr:unnamed protein product [Polarella glacialis]
MRKQLFLFYLPQGRAYKRVAYAITPASGARAVTRQRHGQGWTSCAREDGLRHTVWKSCAASGEAGWNASLQRSSSGPPQRFTLVWQLRSTLDASVWSSSPRRPPIEYSTFDRLRMRKLRYAMPLSVWPWITFNLTWPSFCQPGCCDDFSAEKNMPDGCSGTEAHAPVTLMDWMYMSAQVAPSLWTSARMSRRVLNASASLGI